MEELTYKELERRLLLLGMRHARQTAPNPASLVVHLWVNPADGSAVIIPDKPGTPLSASIIARTAESLGIPVEELGKPGG
jgi:hypothetical protein